MNGRYAPAPRRTAARLVSVGFAVLVGVAVLVATGPNGDVSASATGAAGALIPAAAPEAAVRPAAPGGTASTTVTHDGSAVQLSASPSRGLAAYGAEITVRGSGFDSSADLWIAVCQNDGAAPASLTHCVGGAIPDANGTSAWGIVTSAKQPPYAGPVVAKWKGSGSFTLTLQIPAAAGQDADCLASTCSVYARSSNDTDRSQDVHVPVQFVAAPGSTPGRGGGAPSTQTLGAASTTVPPDSVAETSVAAGAQQTVVFSGFRPGESVDVTLYSDPLSLPPATTDGRGVVTISFTVPADLPVGEHLVQAVGRQSGRVGIASFEVGAATTTASSPSTAASTTGATATLTTPDTAPTVPADLAATDTAASAGDSTGATRSGAAVGASSADSGSGGVSRLLWLWIVLLAVVVIGGAAGLVVLLRRRRDRDAEQHLPPDEATAEPLPQPGWAAYADPTDRAGWPVHATNPAGPLGPAGAADPGPATEQWRPDPGPETQEWAPEPHGENPTGGRHRSE